MIIDAHVYCLPPRLRDPEVLLPESEKIIKNAIHDHSEGPRALRLSAPESVLQSMEASRIDTSVLVAFPWADQDLCRENNDYVLETVSEHDCFMAICAIQPCSKAWIKEAERILEYGAIGIKVNPAWQGYDLDGPEMDGLADFAEQNKIFLMVHVDQPFRKSPASPAHLFNLVQKHPKTRMLAAHMGGLLGLYALHPPFAGFFKNIWFDTALSSTLPLVRCYAEAGLHDKIVFGSDFPFNHSHSQEQVVRGIRELGFAQNVENAIFHENFSLLNGY